jgi:RsiW-degrading membrane proteinase PrsW (M82 family)
MDRPLVRLAALLAALVAAVIAGALSLQLPGTNDVAMEFEVAVGEKAPAGFDSSVRRRFAAFDVPADVSSLGDRGVRVVVPADMASTAAGAIAWGRTVAIYRLVPDASPSADVGEVPGYLAYAEGKNVVVPARDDRSLIELAQRLGDEPVAVAVGPSVLWRGPLHGVVRNTEGSGSRAALLLPAGRGVDAYRRARRLSKKLGSAWLPRLVQHDQRALAPDWLLASATVALPILVGLAWLVLLRRFDRTRPEPWWLVLTTFALGALSQSVAGFVELRIWHATPYLNPRVMALDLSAPAFFVDWAVSAVGVGFLEEGVKLLAAWSLAMHRREFDEPVDGIVYGAVASIGFATMEAIGYFSWDRLSDSIVTDRSLYTFTGHAFYGVIWGYALGKRLVGKKPRVWPYFVAAVLLHALWDTSCDFGLRNALIALHVALVITFVVLVRRALRWGSTDQVRGDAPASSHRTLFRVGRPRLCAASIAAMFLCGGKLSDMAWETTYHATRAALWSSAWADALVVLFAIIAFGATSAIPLDVAVDPIGVTFAGALWRWPRIAGVLRTRRGALVLQTDAGAVSLGPGRPATIDALEASIRAGLDRPPPTPPEVPAA